MQLGSDEKKNYFQVVLTSSSGAKNQPTQVSPSILHLSKKRSNLRAYGHYDPMWGTNGSVLTPGTRRDGRKNPEPVLSGFRTGFPVRARFALLWLNQGTYRHGRGTQGSGLT